MKIADKTSKKSLPIGIIGTGSIGSFVARAIVRGEGDPGSGRYFASVQRTSGGIAKPFRSSGKFIHFPSGFSPQTCGRVC
jgi:hypothetical protein